MSLRSAGLALLAVAVLTGCGSVSASVKDLRQDAGLICRRSNRGFRGLRAPAGAAQAASFLTRGAGRLESQLGALRRVTPPRDVADVYRAALTALAQELTLLRKAAADTRLGEDPALAYKTLGQQLGPLESQANNAWQALQIADCLQ
jgi:hypothetical protein